MTHDAQETVDLQHIYHSDPFELKVGLYAVTVSHTGKHRCRVKLTHGDGALADVITSASVHVAESRTVLIERDGFNRLDVRARSDRIVRMAYQEPKTAGKAEISNQEAAAQMPAPRSPDRPVRIKLKNGRTLKGRFLLGRGQQGRRIDLRGHHDLR